MYNVAGRDRTSDLSNNSRPCNHTEDFVWNWPNYPKFVTVLINPSTERIHHYLNTIVHIRGTNKEQFTIPAIPNNTAVAVYHMWD